jgi:hypothetical protein
VTFGPDDAFLATILKLLRRLPIYPMFGRGQTRLQPAFVEDVAEAIARTMQIDGRATIPPRSVAEILQELLQKEIAESEQSL